MRSSSLVHRFINRRIEIVAHALMRAAFTVLTGVSGNKHVDVIGNKTFPIEG